VSLIYYVTHPQVVIDPSISIEQWTITDEAAQRVRLMLTQSWIGNVARIISSHETKAIVTAELIGSHLIVAVETRDDLGEIDRSATGYLAADDYDRVTEEFFAEPEKQARGWERATDCQNRILRGLDDLFVTETGTGDSKDIIVVGHGGVGTLWYCALAGLPIARNWDQPGQGHYFSVDRSTRRPLHHWRPIEE
jgi:broad specificity phosphatase PhoE